MPELQSATAAHATKSSSTTAFPWWMQTIVLLGAFLMAAGALIALLNPAMLVSPHEGINAAVHIYAGYLFSRNAALAILLVAALLLRSKTTLNALVLLSALIQVLDVVIDCVEGRWTIVPGILVFGVLYLLAAARLSGYPFWRKQAWRLAP